MRRQMRIRFASGRYENFVAHSCGRYNGGSCDTYSESLDSRPTEARPTDVTEEMKAMVDRLALSMTDTPRAIWDKVRGQFLHDRGDQEGLVGLSWEQVRARVYRVRNEAFVGDIYARIEQEPLSRVLTDQGNVTSMQFFQFHISFYNKQKRCMERLLGWAHPRLLGLLSHRKISLFVDGTFRIVPAQFSQCMVFLVHDRHTKGYYPAVFMLLTSKSYDAYFAAVRALCDLTDFAIEPAFIYCDFESGLLRALTDHFNDVPKIGCLLNWKQACLRRMKKLRISASECKIAMKSGVLDMLTVLPQRKISKQGINWVQNTVKAKCESNEKIYSESKWKQFWTDFKRTWVEMFPPEVWNISEYSSETISRTNNPLERFNRELNDDLKGTHPNLFTFVNIIERVARRHAELKRQRENKLTLISTARQAQTNNHTQTCPITIRR